MLNARYHLSRWLQSCVPYVETSITYLLVVAAALSFRELVVGKLRQGVTTLALSGLLIALLAVGWFVVTGEKYTLIRYNNLISAGALIVLLVFLSVPALNRKYGVLQYRGVLLMGCSIFCVEALYVSLMQPLGMGHDIGRGWDDLGFAVLLSSLAYVICSASMQTNAVCQRSRTTLRLPGSCSFRFCRRRPHGLAGCALLPRTSL